MGAFDLYQQHRIRRTDQRLAANESNNEHRYRRNRDDIDQLHARIDKLLLINEALWQLVAESTGLTDAQLTERVRQLDQIDGVEDGRRQPMASDCACGAKVNPKSPICQYCGAGVRERSVFDTV